MLTRNELVGHSPGRRAQQPGLPAGPRYLRQGHGSDDPLKLIQEATEIMGPNSDILDTRAVVLISQKQYEPAIQALELSVTDTPTASKYYHKAVAHLAPAKIAPPSKPGKRLKNWD